MNIHIYLSLQKFTCDFILGGLSGLHLPGSIFLSSLHFTCPIFSRPHILGPIFSGLNILEPILGSIFNFKPISGNQAKIDPFATAGRQKRPSKTLLNRFQTLLYLFYFSFQEISPFWDLLPQQEGKKALKNRSKTLLE